MYKEAFAYSPDPTLIVRADGRIHDANQACADLFECDIDSIVGSGIDDVISTKSRESLHELLSHSSEASGDTLGTISISKKENRLAQLAWRRLKDTEDHVVLVFIHDISGSEVPYTPQYGSLAPWLKDIVDNMLEGVQVINRDWEYLYLNNAAEEQSQKKKEELIGHTMQEMYPGIEETDMFQTLKKCADDQQHRQLENEFKFPNGNVGWFQLSIQPMHDLILILSTDITELKQTKLLLEERNLELQEKNREILRSQSKLLSTQINPHFIFNVLNSLQDYVLKNETESALLFIADFSRLIRYVLNNSLHTHIPLTKSLEFLELYLNLEKHRLEDKFEYALNINDDIDPDQVYIPPMLIQPYLENTIVHGIGHLKSGGKVRITLEKKGNSLICSITDNGVGRIKSRELKKNNTKNIYRSLAMPLTKKRLETLELMGHGKYSVRVNDVKKSDGEISGTTVKLQIPLIEDTSMI